MHLDTMKEIKVSGPNRCGCVLLEWPGLQALLCPIPIPQVDVKFKYNSVIREFSCADYIYLRGYSSSYMNPNTCSNLHLSPSPTCPGRIPLGSAPPPVNNITLAASTFLGEEVEIQFVWESPGTPCYPVRQYHISLSSPRLEDHFNDVFEVEGRGGQGKGGGRTGKEVERAGSREGGGGG